MENSTTKCTVRLSKECDAALAEVGSLGINKSEFIREAVINYHASGSWRPSDLPDRVEDLVKVEKEDKASDRVSDKVSYGSAAEVFNAGFFNAQTRAPGPQMTPPHSSYPYANPRPVPSKKTGQSELALILIVGAIIAVVLFVVPRKESERRKIRRDPI